MSEHTHIADLAGFAAYFAELRRGLKRQYDRSVNRDLSRQDSQGLFGRNVPAVLRQCYDDALQRLRQPPILSDEIPTDRLTVQALQALDGCAEELMQYALQKHRTTCAISNFPEEHDPSATYIAEVVAATNADWQAFVVQVEGIVSGKPPQ